jgi:hypothetical protein
VVRDLPALKRSRGRLEVGEAEKQVEHFNRSLSQVTADWRCPELYYLRRGEYVPNPHVPLQWTQANLLVALHDKGHARARCQAGSNGARPRTRRHSLSQRRSRRPA